MPKVAPLTTMLPVVATATATAPPATAAIWSGVNTIGASSSSFAMSLEISVSIQQIPSM